MNVFGLFQVEFLCYEIMEISIFVKAHCEDSELIILLINVYVCLFNSDDARGNNYAVAVLCLGIILNFVNVKSTRLQKSHLHIVVLHLSDSLSLITSPCDIKVLLVILAG